MTKLLYKFYQNDKSQKLLLVYTLNVIKVEIHISILNTKLYISIIITKVFRKLYQ